MYLVSLASTYHHSNESEVVEVCANVINGSLTNDVNITLFTIASTANGGPCTHAIKI